LLDWKENILLSAVYSMMTRVKPKTVRDRSTMLKTGVLAGADRYRAGRKGRKAEYEMDSAGMGPAESSMGGRTRTEWSGRARENRSSG